MGNILELADLYSRTGADELVFYDIAASPDGRTVDRDWVSRVAEFIDIPFCVAGGIRSTADAEEILCKGADKISINSPALQDPSLISALAKRFGSQCVVLGVDSLRVGNVWQVCQYTGDSNRTTRTNYTTADWVAKAQDLGVGEVVLNCMNQDGVREGYDIDQLVAIQGACHVPLVASGGAGSMQDFAELFEKTHVSAALAAGVFHNGDITISNLKVHLASAGIEVRL